VQTGKYQYSNGNHDKPALNLEGQADLAPWPTPQEHDKTVRGNTMADHHHYPHDLSNAAQMANWATPSTRDYRSNTASEAFHAKRRNQARGKPLNEQAHQLTASGPTPSGSGAATKSTGQLNPAHSRWLMGLPPEWCACAVTATLSVRRRPRPS
jgi:hypothetical protein